MATSLAAPLAKATVNASELTTAAPKPLKGYAPGGINIQPPVTPTGTGTGTSTGPMINPPSTPTGDTAVSLGGKGIITSYAGGGGPQMPPQILPPSTPTTETAVPFIQKPIGETFTNPNTGIVPPNIQPPAPSNPGASGTGAGAGTGAGNPITSFGPGNDLVSAQVNPVVSGRTGDTMSAVDAARNALSGGPNRADLASQYLSQWDQASQPQYQKDLRDATKLAAANGRLGSGMLTNSYGDLATNRANARDVAAKGFYTDALSGTINDRLNNLGALSGLESQQYGQDAANRNEVRGERGYQQGLSQQAFSNDAQRLALEEALTQGSYGRSSDRLNQLIQMGFMGNPGTTYLGASGQVQQGAQQSNQALSDLLSQYFLGKGVGG